MNLDNYPERVAAEFDRVARLPIIVQIFKDLNEDLPAHFKYHCADHSMDVLSEVVLLAVVDSLSEEEIELLGIAAAFHDSGFLMKAGDNEEIAAEKAAGAMRASKAYSEDEVVAVSTMILDTRLPGNGARYAERPSFELSKYLLDADLGNLGREDFVQKLTLIGQEFGLDEKQNFRNTYELLKNHFWYTPAAKKLRESQKQKNLIMVEQKLKDLEITA